MSGLDCLSASLGACSACSHAVYSHRGGRRRRRSHGRAIGWDRQRAGPQAAYGLAFMEPLRCGREPEFAPEDHGRHSEICVILSIFSVHRGFICLVESDLPSKPIRLKLMAIESHKNLSSALHGSVCDRFSTVFSQGSTRADRI